MSETTDWAWGATRVSTLIDQLAAGHRTCPRGFAQTMRSLAYDDRL